MDRRQLEQDRRRMVGRIWFSKTVEIITRNQKHYRIRQQQTVQKLSAVGATDVARTQQASRSPHCLSLSNPRGSGTFSRSSQAAEDSNAQRESPLAMQLALRIEWTFCVWCHAANLHVCHRKPNFQNGRAWTKRLEDVSDDDRFSPLLRNPKCIGIFVIFTAMQFIWVLKEHGETWDGAYFRDRILTELYVIPFLSNPVNVVTVYVGSCLRSP